MQSYAARIAQKIDDSKPFILVGLSFGGMLATEVMQCVQPQKTILLSSAATRKELPLHFRITGWLGLNKFIPSKAVNKSNAFTNWLFGITAEKDKILLEQILSDSNTTFSKWAINEIVNWKRTITPTGIIRIHGDKDRVLPCKKNVPDYIIKGGGHFMVVNRAAEISAIFKKILTVN
jgi:esterase/lipase